jgi:antitoxin YefM
MASQPPRAARDDSPEIDQAELETLGVLSDPEALADIREADAAYARGDAVRGVDAVRALVREN